MKISVANFKANWNGFNRQKQKMTLKKRKNFWSIQGDFVYLQNLDVLQETRIDDHWQVDANRSLSESWKEFTKFTLLKAKPPKGCMWSGERLTNGPKLENPLKREKSKNGQTRSQNSIMLEGYFIDPDDGEHKETAGRARLMFVVTGVVYRVHSNGQDRKRMSVGQLHVVMR